MEKGENIQVFGHLAYSVWKARACLAHSVQQLLRVEGGVGVPPGRHGEGRPLVKGGGVPLAPWLAAALVRYPPPGWGSISGWLRRGACEVPSSPIS
jgi:hypothetical protein